MWWRGKKQYPFDWNARPFYFRTQAYLIGTISSVSPSSMYSSLIFPSSWGGTSFLWDKACVWIFVVPARTCSDRSQVLSNRKNLLKENVSVTKIQEIKSWIYSLPTPKVLRFCCKLKNGSAKPYLIPPPPHTHTNKFPLSFFCKPKKGSAKTLFIPESVKPWG